VSRVFFPPYTSTKDVTFLRAMKKQLDNLELLNEFLYDSKVTFTYEHNAWEVKADFNSPAGSERIYASSRYPIDVLKAVSEWIFNTEQGEEDWKRHP
jgi:hypothetical protein